MTPQLFAEKIMAETRRAEKRGVGAAARAGSLLGAAAEVSYTRGLSLSEFLKAAEGIYLSVQEFHQKGN